jgi:chromosomal replication initiation ATPase DnaA
MTITTDRIIEEVSEVFNCDVAVMKSPMRSVRVSLAKYAAIFLIRKYNFGLSLGEVASIFCYKKASSVSRANNAAWNSYTTDSDFKSKVLIVERKLISIRLEAGI